MCLKKKPESTEEPQEEKTELTEEQEKQADAIFTYIAQMSEKIYEHEIERTTSLIEQASKMQAAFSFMFTSIFMVAQIVFEYSVLSKVFLTVVFSSVGLTLLFSIFSATIVQHRRKREDFVSAKKFSEDAIDNYQLLITEAQRQKHRAETYAKIQKSMSNINKKREKWIRASMDSFYLTVFLCVFWFIMGLLIAI